MMEEATITKEQGIILLIQLYKTKAFVRNTTYSVRRRHNTSFIPSGPFA